MINCDLVLEKGLTGGVSPPDSECRRVIQVIVLTMSTCFAYSPGQKLEAMVISENNRKLEIDGNNPKERAYQYKVLYPDFVSACHDVHAPCFLSLLPCLWLALIRKSVFFLQVLGAIVGAKRLDVLDRQVRNKLSQLSGLKHLVPECRNFYALFSPRVVTSMDNVYTR